MGNNKIEEKEALWGLDKGNDAREDEEAFFKEEEANDNNNN